MSGWVPPSATERKAIIDRSHTVAIVGASSNPARASNFVATYLLSKGDEFDVWMVNPRETEILGQPVYPSLQDLPGTPDIVDVFRKPSDMPGVATEAVDIAHGAGLDVVMDRCLKIEHARFSGGLNLAGFDTGVISSRRRR